MHGTDLLPPFFGSMGTVLLLPFLKRYFKLKKCGTNFSPQGQSNLFALAIFNLGGMKN